MPSAPKRRSNRPANQQQKEKAVVCSETERPAKAAKLTPRNVAKVEEAKAKKENAVDTETGSSQDTEDSSSDGSCDNDDASSGTDDASETVEPETQWFNLEGCDPTPEDAPGVVRLLRQFQLPCCVGDVAKALADRLVSSPKWRQFTSVVKQCIDEEDADVDETVYSVVGVADLTDFALRRLSDYLAAASPSTKAALDGNGSGAMLLVNARAPELPLELALAQLEALHQELKSHQVAGFPKLFIVLSPGWRIGDEYEDSKGGLDASEIAPMHAEDEVLQDLSAGNWEVLPSQPGGSSPSTSSAAAATPELSSACHRVCVLEVSRLGDAIEKLRQSVRDKLKPT